MNPQSDPTSASTETSPARDGTCPEPGSDSGSDAWFDDDRFWEVLEPIFFGPRRLGATPEQTDQMLALLDTPAGGAILDLCCGSGRFSLELAARGFAVTGVDRTSRYLDHARQEARGRGLEIEWIQEDMRRFERVEAFDAVINMFTSFGYFEDAADDRRVAANAYRSLRPGGRILLELMGREVIARHYRARDWYRNEDGSLLLQERELSGDWSWIKDRWIVLRGEEREEFCFGHRLYTGTELAALLCSVGFTGARVFGSLAGAPYDQDAGRLVVVAEKPGR